MSDSRHYKAFISYSHSDEPWARWLQRSLENYKLPKTLRQAHPELPARLYPLFRDRDELASGGDLSDSIRTAMDDSEALIVICSPAARASHWVNEEIKRFKASDRGQRIFCLLVSGSPDPNAADCAFPIALLLDDDGLTLHEPLAADATSKGDGKRNAMLKIAAGLLGVGVDDLKRRDAQRQARYWSFVAFGSLFIAALTIGLAIYALNAKRESEIRRHQAEGLISFMLGDLRKKLEPIGKLEILDAVGDQAMEYFATLGDRGTPKELLERAKALKQIGDVRFNQGKLEPALKAFQQSLIQSEALYKADPSNNDNLFELGQAEFWVGYVAYERGELNQAAVSMQHYMQYSKQLSERAPDNDDYQLELSYAYNNLGAVALAQNNPESALDKYVTSDAINSKLLEKDTANFDRALNKLEALSWIGSIQRELGHLSESQSAFQKSINIIRPFHMQNKDQRATAAYVRSIVFNADVDYQMGAVKEATAMIEEAQRVNNQLMMHDPSNKVWLFTKLKGETYRLSFIPPGDWTSENRKALENIESQTRDLAAKEPANASNSMLLAFQNRLRIIDLLVQGKNLEAKSAADKFWGEWQIAVKAKPLSYEQIYIQSLLEETTGTANAAAGDFGKAHEHWLACDERLVASKSKNLALLAAQRLLAIDLGQTEKAKEIEKQLIQAGYKDPRMDPAYTLSGTFR